MVKPSTHPEKLLYLDICVLYLLLLPGYYTCWVSAHCHCVADDATNLVQLTLPYFSLCRDVAADILAAASQEISQFFLGVLEIYCAPFGKFNPQESASHYLTVLLAMVNFIFSE